MDRYAYSYRREIDDGEVFFRFPALPEVFSTLPEAEYRAMAPRTLQVHVTEAVLSALQTRIAARLPIPDGDGDEDRGALGVVILNVQQAMKIEMYKVLLSRCSSVSEFARLIDRKVTAARRLVDLRHPSVVTEIEAALEVLGRRLVHSWSTEPDSAPGHMARLKP